MRTVIIDDELKGRQTLKNFILKYAHQLNIVGDADCVEKGIELIDTVKPQLVFLDIQMPDGTGFDLLGQINYSDFKLIFCTAYDNYAVTAFRYSASDYLLKPISPDIFKAAVEKVASLKNNNLVEQVEVLKANSDNFNRIALHSSEGIHLVNVNDIIRCESSVNYTRFYLKDKSKILVTKTLKEFDEILSQQQFIRIHKSHLVNLKHISQYIKGEGGWVIMSDNSKVEVSRRKKETLLKNIEGN